MAECLVNAPGGLCGRDKQEVRNWMVEGHSVLNGRVSGSIPQVTGDDQGYVNGIGNATEGEVWVQPPKQSAYYNGARWLKGAVPELTAGNLRAGVRLPGGLVGSFTADATARAEDLLTGKIAYVNGGPITGTYVPPVYGVSYVIAMGNSSQYDSGGVHSTAATGLGITYNAQVLDARAYTDTLTILESGYYAIYLIGVVERYVNKTAWSGLLVDGVFSEDEAYGPVSESLSGCPEFAARSFNRVFHKWLDAGQTVQGYAWGANSTLNFASVEMSILRE